MLGFDDFKLQLTNGLLVEPIEQAARALTAFELFVNGRLQLLRRLPLRDFCVAFSRAPTLRHNSSRPAVSRCVPPILWRSIFVVDNPMSIR